MQESPMNIRGPFHDQHHPIKQKNSNWLLWGLLIFMGIIVLIIFFILGNAFLNSEKDLSNLEGDDSSSSAFVLNPLDNQTNTSTPTQNEINNQLDATPLSITIQSPLNKTYFQSSILIKFNTPNGNLDSLWFYNGSENVSYSNQLNIILHNGPHTLNFYANDSLGNLVTKSVTFFVDSREILNCQQLKEVNGNYTLIKDIISSNDSITCLEIGADNITLDCNGYSLTGTESYGIQTRAYDNIKIKNCEINYEMGIDFSSSTNIFLENIHTRMINIDGAGNFYHHIENILLDGDSNNGIVITNTLRSFLKNISVKDKTGCGVLLVDSFENNLTNIFSNENKHGVCISRSSENNITGITTNKNELNGIWIYSTSFENIIQDVISNENLYGISLINSRKNNFTNMEILNNIDRGIDISVSDRNQFRNVVINGANEYGIYDGGSEDLSGVVSGGSNLFENISIFNSGVGVKTYISKEDSFKSIISCNNVKDFDCFEGYGFIDDGENIFDTQTGCDWLVQSGTCV